ncbi:PH domain-containing protein [Lentilactobacillus sp. SPB1-3]|uniref:PH domain-containing protein n=1 Tax=Lentilactobacillus terminaliae TaxID=3003483 RepID=A0ACD5DG89_9LACO|nr:PH domain-containing protein [Lentilactobacillus sp. SPB1-3]MCZ0976498.1 PH domain-containing protein [Lentilactobacillus sp. SPB1-3]
MTSKKHLNPVALIYFIYKTLADWLWIIFIVFASLLSVFQKVGISLPMVVTAFVILIVISSIIRYGVFTYEIGEEMLTINSGIFVKKHLHIPYQRIQTITQDQQFFLIPFHLETLNIETAGQESDKAEAILPMVPESTRSIIESHRHPTSAVTDADIKPDDNVYHIDSHSLNIFALTSLGILPILAVLGAVYGRIQDAIPERYLNSLFALMANESILIIVSVIVILLIIGMIISYLMTIFKYYRFTISEDNGQLQTTQGLITKRSFSVKQQRIQAVVFKQNIIRQLFKLTTVQTVVASNAGKQEEEDDITLVPVINNHLADSMTHRFVDWVPEKLPSLAHLPHRSYWYYIRNASLISILMVAIFVSTFRIWGLTTLILLPFAIWIGWYAAKNNGYYIGNHQLIISNGHLLTKSITVVETKNIQSFEVRQSIWMHRTGLAHFVIHIRSKNSDKELRLRYIPKAEADNLFNWLS